MHTHAFNTLEMLCNHHLYQALNHPNRKHCTHYITNCHSLHSLATTNPSISMDLPILDISYWNQTNMTFHAHLLFKSIVLTAAYQINLTIHQWATTCPVDHT